MRAEWRVRKRLTLETGFGGIWPQETDAVGEKFSNADYYVYAGYRFDF